MLLFGKDPRRFFNNIQVHCFHFHGTEKLKPIASQQPYEGRLIEVIDDAVEKAGTGTTDMIADCRKAGLPEPDFEQRGPYFVVTVWRDRLTEDVIASLGLNDRQKTAVLFTKQNGRITNKQYQELSKVTDRTVLRDIQELVNKDVLHKIGITGRATYYVIKKKPHKPDMTPFVTKSDINPTSGRLRVQLIAIGTCPG